jgi:hypothetical protein
MTTSPFPRSHVARAGSMKPLWAAAPSTPIVPVTAIPNVPATARPARSSMRRRPASSCTASRIASRSPGSSSFRSPRFSSVGSSPSCPEPAASTSIQHPRGRTGNPLSNHVRAPAVNRFAIRCLWDQNFSVELADPLLPPDRHQIADRGGITCDGHRSQALWRRERNVARDVEPGLTIRFP